MSAPHRAQRGRIEDNCAARLTVLAAGAENDGVETGIFLRVPCTTVLRTGIIGEVPDAAHTAKTVDHSSEHVDSIQGL